MRGMWRHAALVAMLLPVVVRADQETVIPLKVHGPGVPNCDTRVFSVPVTCNGVRADFIWGCGGWTIVTESFARKAGLRVRDDDAAAQFVAGDGTPIFAGSADANIHFGERQHRESVMVIRDGHADQGMTGIVGYAIARAFQWEVNPDRSRPTLTLRPLGTRPTTRPLALVPLMDQDESLLVSVKVRGEKTDLSLLPQSTDMQAGPELQRRWDMLGGKAEDIKSYVGAVRTKLLTGKDAVELSPAVIETNVRVILMGGPKDEPSPATRSGLGASLLNRWVYCVDPQLKQFMVIGRPSPATRPASSPSPEGRRQGGAGVVQ